MAGSERGRNIRRSARTYIFLYAGPFPRLLADQNVWNVQRENNICMEIRNVPVRGYAFRIEEFGSNISKSDGQYFSERKECQVVFP